MKPATPVNEPLFYTVTDAIRVSGLSRTALYEALKNKALAARKHGKRTLISRVDLMGYMANLPAWKPAEDDDWRRRWNRAAA